jgi:rubrerythrin
MTGWDCGNCGHFIALSHKPLFCPQCGNRREFHQRGGGKSE